MLPNGPDMATAFLSIAAGAVAAPLNPAYRAEEFEFYLSDLSAKAVIVEAGVDRARRGSRAQAQHLGVRASRRPRLAGAFKLTGTGGGRSRAGRPRKRRRYRAHPAYVRHDVAAEDRAALPSQRLCVRARISPRPCASTAADRGLGVMPLFHIHGLIAGLLAPLSRGGTVVCTPGFEALRFFAQMKAARPTWVTAVPTMHQAILGRAARNKDVIAAHPLRFLRSSSASMPPQVIGELEAVFGAPLIEAYGMTEAAHQMASNPLKGARKPGSVGPAAGPEIAIMGEDGALLKTGEIGEVVIRGLERHRRLREQPDGQRRRIPQRVVSHRRQGALDEDRYLNLTGRLKEIINRGGEKITPREVDEALMDHAGVAQVVTFATKHDMLGEDVAAAVVLREGASATESELREFAAKRLAPFKVPRKIVFLAEIPKGATGKLQRIGLAEKLGL